MKKIFTLIAALVCAVCVNAQEKLSLSGGWGQNVAASGTVQLTATGQWGEYKLCNENFSVVDYPKFRITYSNMEGTWQTKIENASSQGQFNDITEASGVIELEFNQETFASDPVITFFEVQSKEATGTITIENVELISSSGTSISTKYTTNWGINATVYGGIATFNSQWGELGDWSATFEEGDKHTYTINLNTPAPADFQFKVYYDDNESYPAIEEGKTSISIDIDKAYSKLTIQYKGTETGVLDIASVTRTITKSTGITSTEVININNNDRYNLLGVKNGNGVYIMNGKKYLK